MWFVPPFAVPETCKPIENWKTSSQYRVITDKFGKLDCQHFFEDYEAIIRNWVRRKVLGLGTKSVESIAETQVFDNTFVLESASGPLQVGCLNDKDNETHTLRKYLRKALLYFLKEIVSENILLRLKRLRQEHGDSCQWSQAKSRILWGMVDDRTPVLLEQLVKLKRTDREGLLVWIQEIQSIKAELTIAGSSLSEDGWVAFARRGMSTAERVLFLETTPVGGVEEMKTVTLKDVETAILARDPSSLPVFRKTDVSSKDESERRQEKCTFCGHLGHKMSQCRKKKRDAARKLKSVKGVTFADEKTPPAPGDTSTRKQPASKPAPKPILRTRERVCYKCNQPGHVVANCPLNRKQTYAIWQTLSMTGCNPILKVQSTIRIGDHRKPVIVALDTCSSINIVVKEYGIVTNDSSAGPMSASSDVSAPSKSVSVFGGMSVRVGPPADVCLLHEGREIHVTCYTADSCQIPSRCALLLGTLACADLGVDVNWHLQHFREHNNPDPERVPPMKLLPGRDTESKVSDSDEREILHRDQGVAVTLMAERRVRDCISRLGLPNQIKPLTLEDVHVSSTNLSTEQQKRIRALVCEFRAIFASRDTVPPPMVGDPHRIQLVDDWRPKYCPCPRWSTSQEEYLRAWGELYIQEGLLEPAPNSVWASRAHLAEKPGKSVADFGIRVCGDFVNVNTQIKKLVPNLPRIKPDLVDKIGNKKFYFQTDGMASYWTVLLHAASRDITSIWLPQGLMRFTRLPFGMKNSGTVLQGRMSGGLNELPIEVRKCTTGYVDDISMGEDDFEPFIMGVKSIFSVCQRNQVTLKPTKTYIGDDHVLTMGYEIGRTITVAEKNTAPLRDYPTPTDVPSLRRFLGLIAMSKDHIRDFSQIAQPLTRLTGKVPWIWGPEEAESFQQLVQKVIERAALFFPDYSLPFVIETDASDVAMGAVLYQEIAADESSDEVEKRVIRYLSKKFNNTETRRPVYYREAQAIVWAISETRYYTDNSPHQVLVRTDHAPLQWIHRSTKGPISRWLVEDLVDVDFTVEYIRGESNGTADALSRIPLSAPGVPTSEGREKEWNLLLRNLDPDWAGENIRLWIWSPRDTTLVIKLVREWRSVTGPIITVSPQEKAISEMQWDIAFIEPRAEEAPAICRRLLSTGKPCAMLVPSDLVHVIAPHSPLQDIVDQATKITMLIPCATWILATHAGKKANGYGDVVYQLQGEDPLELRHILEEQAAEGDVLAEQYRPNIVTRPSGLLMVAIPGDVARVLVPTSLRKRLVMMLHEHLEHVGPRKTLEALKRSYIWPGISKDCHQWIKACRPCQLSKATHNLRHGQFRAVTFEGPGEALAMDLYAVAESEDGMREILTVIDLCSREVDYHAMPDRTGDQIVRVLLREVIFRNGVPSLLHSDEAPELLSQVMSGLTRMLGINRTTTVYYPAGNAVCERVQRFLGGALRRLPPEDRPRWPEFLTRFSFALNCTVTAPLQCSPFELGHGRRPRTILDAMVVEAPDGESIVIPSGTRALGMYGKLRESMHTLMEWAKEHDIEHKEESARRLNNRSGPINQFTTGDLVMIYVPDAGDVTWKKKHCIQWRGPCRVTQRRSKTVYVVEELATGRAFVRSVSNIRAYVSSGPDETLEEIPETPVGNIIAVRDDTDPSLFWLAKVTDNRGAVHYLATIDGVKFTPAYIEPDGMTLLSNRRPGRRSHAIPWTGSVAESDVVLASNVRLTRRGRLTASAKTLLNGLSAAIIQ